MGQHLWTFGVALGWLRSSDWVKMDKSATFLGGSRHFDWLPDTQKCIKVGDFLAQEMVLVPKDSIEMPTMLFGLRLHELY